MSDLLTQSSLGQRLLMLREAKGLSLRTLAEKVGLSASFLSQVERDEASPSIASLEKIAQALGVALASLFSQSPPDPLVRAGNREQLESSWSKACLERLSRVGGALQPRLLTLQPGGGTGFLPSEQRETFLLVSEGCLKARLNGEVIELKVGDALHVLPEHALVELTNPSNRRTVVLLVSTHRA